MNPPRYGWSYTEGCVSVSCPKCKTTTVVIPNRVTEIVAVHAGHEELLVIQ